jgi:hypothetical protein
MIQRVGELDVYLAKSGWTAFETDALGATLSRHVTWRPSNSGTNGRPETLVELNEMGGSLPGVLHNFLILIVVDG